MDRDPRNPNPEHMVHNGSTHPFHANMRKTLVLLCIPTAGEPVYFVVEGLATWPMTYDELQEKDSYFYEEGTCPTNFIRIPMISHGGDADPHGVFEHVETVWMLSEYDADDADDYLLSVFPQLSVLSRAPADTVTDPGEK